MGAGNAKADLEKYRNGYPGQEDDPRIKSNLKFYKNEIKSVPNGDTIENIHANWKGNYQLLEMHHGYIQWIFPIREHGMNSQSDPLQLHEAEEIKKDEQCIKRLKMSYDLMLDFYGIKLKDFDTGELCRAENYAQRYNNLNTSGHNYLRITRILKCLGELGLEHMKKNLLLHFIEEVYVTKALSNCRRSLKDYWSETLKDDTEREEIRQIIEKYDPTPVQQQQHSNANSKFQHMLDDDDDDDDDDFVAGDDDDDDDDDDDFDEDDDADDNEAGDDNKNADESKEQVKED